MQRPAIQGCGYGIAQMYYVRPRKPSKTLLVVTFENRSMDPESPMWDLGLRGNFFLVYGICKPSRKNFTAPSSNLVLLFFFVAPRT